MGTIKKISTGYLGGARVVMKNLSDFFRTTAVSKIELHDGNIEDLLEDAVINARIHFNLPTDDARVRDRSGFFGKEENRPISGGSMVKTQLKRGESVKDRRTYGLIHKASMRHRSIALDSNDSGSFFSFSRTTSSDLAELRLAYNTRGRDIESPPSLLKNRTDEVPRRSTNLGMVRERSSSQLRNLLTTTSRVRMDSERFS